MNNQSVKIQKQKHFPFIGDYREKFPINENTIFVYMDIIYSNKTEKDWLYYYDILAHELEHLRSQQEIGADKWIQLYLKSKDFRLKEEKRAYLFQLNEVKKTGDKEELFNIMTECINYISSPLYGNMISYREAEKYFKNKLK